MTDTAAGETPARPADAAQREEETLRARWEATRRPCATRFDAPISRATRITQADARLVPGAGVAALPAAQRLPARRRRQLPGAVRVLRRDLRRLRDRRTVARRQRGGGQLGSSTSSTATSPASSPRRRDRDPGAGPGDRVAERRRARLDRRHRPRRPDLDRDRLRHLRAARGARHLRPAARSAQLLPAQGARPARRRASSASRSSSAPRCASIGTCALDAIFVAVRVRASATAWSARPCAPARSWSAFVDHLGRARRRSSASSPAPQLAWRRIWPGALIGGLGISILQLGAGLLLSYTPSNPLLATFAIFIGLLLWFRLIGIVMLVAAAWIAVAAQRPRRRRSCRRPRPSGSPRSTPRCCSPRRCGCAPRRRRRRTRRGTARGRADRAVRDAEEELRQVEAAAPLGRRRRAASWTEPRRPTCRRARLGWRACHASASPLSTSTESARRRARA